MKFRKFELEDDIDQRAYVTFRTRVQELKPVAWEEIQHMPLELFNDVLIRSAIEAGWIRDIEEQNEYDETTFWSWKESGIEYIDGLPAGKWPIGDWGDLVLKRWIDIKTLDPN
jgi:hypothetical protein